MNKILLIGLGGSVGSLLRFLLSKVVSGITGGEYSYVGTFVANIVGSFALGYLTSKYIKTSKLPAPWSSAIGTGVIGAFTTFSTFSNEVVQLVLEERIFEAMAYLLFSGLIGIISAVAGYFLGRREET